ncbi:MAG: hypothetical protein M3Y42_13900, partial [Actinomycetota bacterium]|nr:hypothetical protein [Actinomycetota bacterium]
MDFDLVTPGLDADRRGLALSFASVAGRRQHGLDRPVLSELAADQCLTGPVTVPAGTLTSAQLGTTSVQVGTGIAFVLDRAVDGPLAADVARAVGYVLPALVILDSDKLA